MEGSLTQLLGHAWNDRVIQRRGTTLATLGLPNIAFTYYVDIPCKNIHSGPFLYADVAVLSRLLDDVHVPVSVRAFVETLQGEADNLGPEDLQQLEQRARSAVEHLGKDGSIRSVRLANWAGWVWSDLAISNDEWRRRSRQDPQPAKPIRIFRMTPPEASVVVIGPAREDGA